MLPALADQTAVCAAACCDLQHTQQSQVSAGLQQLDPLPGWPVQVTYVKGWGKLTGKGEVTVELEGGGQQKVTGKNIMLATGSNSSNLPGIEVDEER